MHEQTQHMHGSCLCGQVGYSITHSLGLFQYCHCSRCRKFTGSAFAANLMVKPDNFCWTRGETLVGSYRPQQSKYFATSFCRNCGSSLPWLNKTGTLIVVPAGTLDNQPDARVRHNIFLDSRAAWYIEPTSLPGYAALPPRDK